MLERRKGVEVEALTNQMSMVKVQVKARTMGLESIAAPLAAAMMNVLNVHII